MYVVPGILAAVLVAGTRTVHKRRPRKDGDGCAPTLNRLLTLEVRHTTTTTTSKTNKESPPLKPENKLETEN